MEEGRGDYKGMQFGGAVKEPQVCSGVRVGDNVTPLLTQVLPDLFFVLRQLTLVAEVQDIDLRTQSYSLVQEL